jgi:hypothetical protein
MPASLFKADLAYSMTKHPLILQLSHAPHCSLAKRPYLRTTFAFNGFPVYAQITQHELTKQENGFQNCVVNHRLLRLLNSTAPNLSDKQFRAGERLLVRQQNAWIVQSVTAYRGFSTQSSACGFHILRIPDGNRENASCFAGLGLGVKRIYEQCSAHLAPWQIDPVDMRVGSSFTFDFDSRRVVTPSFIKGIHYSLLHPTTTAPPTPPPYAPHSSPAELIMKQKLAAAFQFGKELGSKMNQMHTLLDKFVSVVQSM